MEKYQRCGQVTAGLKALRLEHQGFWAAVGAGVPGSYQQRDTCPHLPEG
ncbi:hypothetical protein ACIHCX_33825 [Streptomyces sp. NPDC052043]